MRPRRCRVRRHHRCCRIQRLGNPEQQVLLVHWWAWSLEGQWDSTMDYLSPQGTPCTPCSLGNIPRCIQGSSNSLRWSAKSAPVGNKTEVTNCTLENSTCSL